MATAPIYGGPPGPASPPTPASPPSPAPKKKKVGLLILVLVLVVGCVPCTGVLAAIGLPAFIGYVRRSNTAEATSNLRTLFAGAASYYEQERMGPDGTTQTHCTVGPAVTPNVPTDQKLMLGPLDAAFSELGFAPFDPVFFQYEIVAGPARCGHGPNEALYSFRAHGDLDGDGVTSLFELSVGTNEIGEVFRAPGFFVEQELE
ncbi:MAG: hypothetical protein JRH11_16385 [Deltaproteobacteria bacterium]|nr:hypothetical protein [Deltaproteobacteria bacterium]